MSYIYCCSKCFTIQYYSKLKQTSSRRVLFIKSGYNLAEDIDTSGKTIVIMIRITQLMPSSLCIQLMMQNEFARWLGFRLRHHTVPAAFIIMDFS